MFNDKEMCANGEKKTDGMKISFICKKTKQQCRYVRYCGTDRCYKMIYSSLTCPNK